MFPTVERLMFTGADVYAAPDPMPEGDHGLLIQAQRVVPTPPGLGGVYRVLYRSTSVQGAPIAVSGVVYLPPGRPPKLGWPLISWARGTSGSADICAPSKSIGADDVPLTLARQGFVTAATDYEGLGTPGVHPYLVGASEGRSTLDIVRAADQLPDLHVRREFSVWGHSQGGHAALFARELAREWIPERTLVGTVAIAPPTFIPQAVLAWTTRVRAKGLGLMALAGIASAYPEANLDELMAPGLAAQLRMTLEAGCTAEVNRAFADIDGGSILRADPTVIEPWASLLSRQEPVSRPGEGPALVVQGSTDGTLPPEMSDAVKQQMCARGEQITRWLLADVGHGEVISAAWNDMRQWTRDRFAGVEASSNCGLADDSPSGP